MCNRWCKFGCFDGESWGQGKLVRKILATKGGMPPGHWPYSPPGSLLILLVEFGKGLRGEPPNISTANEK